MSQEQKNTGRKKVGRARREGLSAGQNDLSNNFTIVKDAGIELVFPKFNDGSTIFRPFPLLDEVFEQTGERRLAGYRKSQTDDDFDGLDFWIRKFRAAQFVGFGDDACTFLLYDEGWDEADYTPKYNPYRVFFDATYEAAGRPLSKKPLENPVYPDWAKYFKDMPGSNGPAISKPKYSFFMQGALWKHGKEQYYTRENPPKGMHPKDPLYVLQVGGSDYDRSGGFALLDACNTVNKNWDGDPHDYEHSMLFGDVTSPENGRFITFYNPKLENPAPVEEAEELDLERIEEVARHGGGKAGGEREFRGYQCRLDKRLLIGNRYLKQTARIPDSRIEDVAKKVRLWEDIIVIEEDELQALRIIRAFRKDRRLVEFAFQEYPEWIGDEGRKILANAKQLPNIGMPSKAAAQAAAQEERRTSTAIGDDAEVAADDWLDEEASGETTEYEAGDEVDESVDVEGEYEEGVDELPDEDGLNEEEYEEEYAEEEEGEGDGEEEYEEEEAGADDEGELEYEDGTEDEGDEDLYEEEEAEAPPAKDPSLDISRQALARTKATVGSQKAAAAGAGKKPAGGQKTATQPAKAATKPAGKPTGAPKKKSAKRPAGK